MLTACGMSLSGLAMRGILHDDAVEHQRTRYDMKARAAPSPAKAEAVIQLFQNGGPSQMDLFDPKPELDRMSGKPHPGDVETFQLNNKNILLGTQFKINQYDDSGMHFAECLPQMARHANQWCMIR